VGVVKTYVRVDGRRVAAYDVVGEGPPLVCLPGGPGYAGDQLDLLGGLHAHRRLIRLDLRGAGESDEPPRRTWSLTDYAADLAVVQEHLGEARIDVFGHAHGGLVGAVYATQHPERVGHLVLDGVPARPVHEFDGGTEGGVAAYFTHFDERAQRFVEAHLSRMQEGAMAWFWDHDASTDFVALMAQVPVPTLVITGETDPMAGPAAVLNLARRMTHGRAAVIPEASHFAWVEQRELYVSTVEAFLSSSIRV
jgi:pimeloyl-ACP methyl ester carboxylesterase